MKELKCTEFIEFEEKFNSKLTSCRCKDMDAILSKLLVDFQVFSNCDNIECICVVIGGDHGKGFFTMLVTLFVELRNMDNACYVDEGTGEIDSTEEKM